MSHLRLQNLTKTFGSLPAVQDLWLDVAAGEIVSLLGPSGCGKSTTLQLVAGVQSPDRGAIELDGRLLNAVPPEKRNIALVLQKGLLFPHLTVGENVAFGLKMRGVNRLDREAEAIAMLKQVQLEGFARRKPSQLSGGQAQRVALARALVIQPQLLLLDEPLSALDANLREEMQELILRLQAQTGVTMLVVTHDQAEAVVLSDRVALMFHGRLRQVDVPEVLYQRPIDEATARFFGGVNFFTARLHSQQLQLESGETLAIDSPEAAERVQVTIRPERIEVYAAQPNLPNLLTAIVTANRFTGTQRRLTLQLSANLTLQAWLPPTQDFEVGRSIWLRLPADALWCFPSAD